VSCARNRAAWTLPAKAPDMPLSGSYWGAIRGLKRVLTRASGKAAIRSRIAVALLVLCSSPAIPYSARMRREIDMLAYSLEIEEALLPLLPELLEDFWALGANVETIVAAVADLNLPPTSRVVDLGCGKGAVSISLARRLNFQVLGIDLFEPFVDEARERAIQEGVDHLCEFQHGNIVSLANKIEPSDVAVFAALGDTLGKRSETMRILRHYVRPGGYIIIDDGYQRRADAPVIPGFEGAAMRDVALAGWTGEGDVLVAEHIVTGAEEGQAELIAHRAESVANVHPQLADRIRKFAREQAEEYEYLEQEFVSATWVFRRT